MKIDPMWYGTITLATVSTIAFLAGLWVTHKPRHVREAEKRLNAEQESRSRSAE